MAHSCKLQAEEGGPGRDGRATAGLCCGQIGGRARGLKRKWTRRRRGGVVQRSHDQRLTRPQQCQRAAASITHTTASAEALAAAESLAQSRGKDLAALTSAHAQLRQLHERTHSILEE